MAEDKRQESKKRPPSDPEHLARPKRPEEHRPGDDESKRPHGQTPQPQVPPSEAAGRKSYRADEEE